MNTMSADDLNRTFSSTYIGVRTSNGTVNAAYVESAYTSDVGDVYFNFRNEPSKGVADESLVFDFPEAGMVQIEDHCYWIERRAERQWHRGVRARSFVNDLPRGVDMRQLAQSLFSPSFFELAGHEERSSSRLSSSFSVCSDGCIMYRGTDVAMYNKESNTITCTNEYTVSLIELEQWSNATTITSSK